MWSEKLYQNFRSGELIEYARKFIYAVVCLENTSICTLDYIIIPRRKCLTILIRRHKKTLALFTINGRYI